MRASLQKTDKSHLSIGAESYAYWNNMRKYGERYEGFDWLSVRTLLNFLYTFSVLENHFAKRIQSIGLSIASLNVLVVLSRSEHKGLKQQEIGKLLLVSRANITGLVDHLTSRGLVKRVAHEKDRRVWIAKITQKGEALLDSYLPHHYKEMKRLLSSFSVNDKEVFILLLEKMKEKVLP